MGDKDHRQIGRDSLFLMADLVVDGLDGNHRIKVRNLSSGGMMGEGSVGVVRGAVVCVNIRNVGWVEGTVAWVQGNRFGVAFLEEIDPKAARAPIGRDQDDELSYAHRAPYVFDNRANLRKI
ncbi:MAG: PilZ domain-containing protein [Novosphingobium sp.]|nr:PilZ domain-containing protein [Novosphingobium sp.]